MRTSTPRVLPAAMCLAAVSWLAPATSAQLSMHYLDFVGAGREDLAVDSSGCAYVAGTVGPIIAPPGLPCAASPTQGSTWFAKLDPQGNILWSRRIDGSHTAIAVDPIRQNVYVAARTGNANQFPAVGYDGDPDGGRDGFVARFDAATGCPIAMTYFGDHPDNSIVTPHDIAIDPVTGGVHVVGTTGAHLFSTTAVLEGYVPQGSSAEAFAVGFDATLMSRGYFVYLPGGSNRDNAQSVALDPSGIYVAGSTDSTDLTFTPTRIGPGGRRDSFVMKLDPTASTLLYACIIGGSRDESAQGSNHVGEQRQGAWLALDDSGGVAVTSWTNSNDFPTTDGTSALGQDDAFVSKLLPSGALDWSTLFGGGRIDVAMGIARDGASGTLYVVGHTKSNDFPLPGGLVTQLVGRYDAFLVELNESNGALQVGTLFGGIDDDNVNGGVATDGSGGVYLSGGGSSGFEPMPLTGSFNGSFTAKVTFAPQAGITVAPTAGLATTEAGGTDFFDVVLATQPTAQVSVGVHSDDPTEGLVSTGALAPAAMLTLVFDATNWSTPQRVTVHGQQDPDPDGDVAYTLVTAPAVSTDPGYAGLAAADVAATNLDDEGLSVTGINPMSMNAGTTVAVTISGAGFEPGVAVGLENGAGPAPGVSDVVVVSSTTITATFSASGAGPKGTRTWDVRVTNPSAATGVLAGGFLVVK